MEQRKLASLAILGVLAEKESATIESIHTTLKHNFGRYWGASTGILVPTMNQLKKDGYVEQVSADGSGIAYRLTKSGRNRLKKILSISVEDISHPSSRPELMIKLGYLHHLSVSRQREELRELKDQLRTERDKLLTLEDTHSTEGAEKKPTGYRHELFDLRIRIIDAILQWMNNVEPPNTVKN